MKKSEALFSVLPFYSFIFYQIIFIIFFESLSVLDILEKS